jgi:lipase chaperone LimK
MECFLWKTVIFLRKQACFLTKQRCIKESSAWQEWKGAEYFLERARIEKTQGTISLNSSSAFAALRETVFSHKDAKALGG